MSILNLVIQTDAALIVGPHLAVGDGHMSRVLGVALERFGRLKGGVQHQIGVGRGQTVDVDVDLHEARNLTGQTLEARFDAGLDVCLFGVGIFVLELPENDVLYHDEFLLLLTEILAALIVTSAQKLCKSFYLPAQRRDDIIKGRNGEVVRRRTCSERQEIFGGLRAAPTSAPQDCEEHRMKKYLAHLAAALAVTLLFGAAAGPLSAAAAAPTAAVLDEENTAAAESRLNQSWLDMEIEYNDRNPVYQLYLSSAAPDDWVYQWYSTNPAVATVDRNGLVTAQKPGKATIVANTYTTTLRCDVTVVSNVGRVTLNKERLYLENIGGTAALRASVAVENGGAVPITWTTSNPAAATVDPFGLVTAVGDGEALITATTPDGHSACCNVYCGTQVAIQEQIEADEVKIALGVLGGFAVLVGALALATSGS